MEYGQIEVIIQRQKNLEKSLSALFKIIIMDKLLFDTDVLIEYLRGKEEAKAYIDSV